MSETTEKIKRMLSEGKTPSEIKKELNLKSYGYIYKIKKQLANTPKTEEFKNIEQIVEKPKENTETKAENIEPKLSEIKVSEIDEKEEAKEIAEQFKALNEIEEGPKINPEEFKIETPIEANKEETKPPVENKVDIEELSDFIPSFLSVFFKSRGLSDLTPEQKEKLRKHTQSVIEKRAPAVVTENADLINLGLDVLTISVQKADELNKKKAVEKIQKIQQEEANKPVEEPKPQPKTEKPVAFEYVYRTPLPDNLTPDEIKEIVEKGTFHGKPISEYTL